MDFWPNSKNDIFCQKKFCFSFFGRILLHSVAFLWPQSSRFEPNFQNLLWKVEFGGATHGRLATLEKHQNWPKNANFGLIPVLMVSYGKNRHKFCLAGFLRHLEAKSINKIFVFRFFKFLPDFSKKSFERPKTPIFGLRFLFGWVPNKVLMIF